jgi:hypothetical protein
MCMHPRNPVFPNVTVFFCCAIYYSALDGIRSTASGQACLYTVWR